MANGRTNNAVAGWRFCLCDKADCFDRVRFMAFVTERAYRKKAELMTFDPCFLTVRCSQPRASADCAPIVAPPSRLGSDSQIHQLLAWAPSGKR